ncbi:MAG: LytTR family DNA-binding domain-containing protein [Bacteroidales bacterium]
MISCIVIDDEPLALQQLEQYVAKTPILELKGSFDNAIDALAFLRDNSVDLLFVDINMPKITGLEFVEALPFNCKVIFITAYREYALEGFALDAADYLLKPLSYASFLKAVEKADRRYFTAPQHATVGDTYEKEYIFVRSEYRSVRINFSEIMYVESKREYLDIALTNGEIVTTHGTLNSIGDKLPQNKFIRVHRSFIVNLDQVRVIERNTILFGKLHIPISEQSREIIQKYTS